MRKTNLLVLAFLFIVAFHAEAADRFKFTFSAKGKTTNELGQMTTVAVTSASILKNAAEDTGFQPSGLAMVFDRSTLQVLIVNATNGATLEILFQFEPEIELNNSTDTLTEAYIAVSSPSTEGLTGRGVATVKTVRNTSGDELSFKVVGKLFLAISASDSDATQVYSATMSTGGVFVPRNPIL
jgi:hypothetical protein